MSLVYKSFFFFNVYIFVEMKSRVKGKVGVITQKGRAEEEEEESP